MYRFRAGNLCGYLVGYHAATLPAVTGNLSRLSVTSQAAAEDTSQSLFFQRDAARVTSGNRANLSGKRWVNNSHTHTRRKKTHTDTHTQRRHDMCAYLYKEVTEVTGGYLLYIYMYLQGLRGNLYCNPYIFERLPEVTRNVFKEMQPK
jgi:hypothetical protein